MLHRHVLSVLLLVLALLAAAGCGKKETTGPGSDGGASSGKKILRYGNGAEPSELDPQTVTGIPEHHIIMSLFEGLVTEDPVDLHPVPGMAEKWEISADGLTYTFHLRAGLKWSNGEPLTASDIEASFRRMLTPALASEYSYLLWFVTGAEDYNRGKLADWSQVGFKSPDDRTLVVTLGSPTPFLLQMIASHYSWWPVPVREIAKYGPVDRKGVPWTRAGRLVGNGAFRLKEWTPNQRIVVERNPHYWDAAAVKLDEVEFHPTENLQAEEAMFRTGRLDRTQELPVGKIDTYRKEFPESLRIEPWLGVYFYRFNCTRPPFTDKRVRRALALAIDRESIVENVTRGGQIPAYGVSYPGTAGYVPTAKLEGSLAEAKRLLAEAGFPDGKGFPRVELQYNTQDNHRIIAEAIQQMWRQNLGIEVGLVNQEWKVYLDSQDTLSFDIQRGGWIADYVDPHVFLEIFTSWNLNNDTGWGSDEYDRLFRQALVAKTDAGRYAIYQKMDALLVDECPVMPLYHYTRVYALSPKVKGWHPTLLDNHPFKALNLER